MTAATAPTPGLQADVLRSVRNALTLGLSLMATWAVGLGVRILLPRFLGPDAFGAFQFADAFTTTIFVVATLGLETHVRKEVATRPGHATEFFGGTTLVTFALSVVIMIVALAGLTASGRSTTVIGLVLLLGVAQILFNLNAITAAMLHAVGNVRGLSMLNVASKLAWGGGIVLALALGRGALGAAVAVLVSEALKAVGQLVLARRHVALRFVFDRGHTMGVLRACLPFYVAGIAQTVYARLDMSLMAFLARDAEVGWYGAAQVLAGMALLLSPIIGWVLIPLTSRAAARSEEELFVVARRALEIVLSLAFPATLLLALGADDVVRLAFGPAYAPAGAALRILAPTFVLTYAAMVSSSILIRQERGWAVTVVAIVGMIISPTLNLLFVPRALAWFGAGGAGQGAATALVITEAYTVLALGWLLGRRAFDRQTVTVIAKTLGVCVAVALFDHTLLALGIWRLVADGLLYVALVLGTGAVDARALTSMVRDAMGRRRGATPAEVAA